MSSHTSGALRRNRGLVIDHVAIDAILANERNPRVHPKSQIKALAGSKLAAGTRLLRQWHGTIYEAVVEKDGVIVNGNTYKTLSDAARSITGAHWSGPRFFGLRKVGS